MPAPWFDVAKSGPVQASKLPLENREGFLTGLKNEDGEERLKTDWPKVVSELRCPYEGFQLGGYT